MANKCEFCGVLYYNGIHNCSKGASAVNIQSARIRFERWIGNHQVINFQKDDEGAGVDQPSELAR